MTISFHGACREVTGSCLLVETAKTKFLVDCGIFQGRDFSSAKNLAPFDFNPTEIDFVLLTHAHMDHCGRLPKLYKDGFRGKVYSTTATMDFAQIMLLDSAKVILQEARRQNKPPLYHNQEVMGLMRHFQPLSYNREYRIIPEIKVRLKDAGHILGSAIIEVWVEDGGQKKKLVFSGDLGNPPAPIIRDTETVTEADYVFIESTYGGRVHESKGERKQLLKEAIVGSIGRGGALVIPAFALERTQEVLYELNDLAENKKIPRVPVFVDSPLAIKATTVYKKYTHMYDRESRALIESGDDLFNFPGLTYTKTTRQSKTINHILPPKVILAGSGMCTGGRIPYHLKFNLPDPRSHLLIISYQVVGSLGRKLLDGAKNVLIDGQRVKVRAKVSAIGSYSSHADRPKLMRWLQKIKPKNLKRIFVIHGEEESNFLLAKSIQEKIGLEATVPKYNVKYTI